MAWARGHAVVTGSNIVKCLAVAGAAGDSVDEGVNEAKVVMSVLVGQRDEPAPQRRGTAGAGSREDPCLAAGSGDYRGAARLTRVTGHVRHTPHLRDPRDAALIGRTGVQVAEAAPRC